MQELDLAHLAVFEAIYKHRSVVKAARMLDMSQPTVSRWLARLRENLSDPLFVRTQNGMEPTTTAIACAEPISQILQIYHTQLRNAGTFEPASSNRMFRIAASDLGHLIVLPPLFAAAKLLAPSIRFDAVPLARQELITGLESGEVDLAIGGFPRLSTGVQEQTLFEDTYVCVMQEGNPLLAHPLTLDTFRNASHLLVKVRSLGHVHHTVEQDILAICPPENIRVVSESFIVAALLLGRSDMILTVPARVAMLLGGQHGLVRVPAPMKLPTLQVKQYWHERFHGDPGNRWLRRSAWKSVRQAASVGGCAGAVAPDA